MSTILAKGGVPVLPLSSSVQVSTPHIPTPDVPASPSVIAVTPGPSPTDTHHSRSLREVKLQEQAGRDKRDTDVKSAAVPPAKAGKVRRRYPAAADAEKADIALQKRLVNGLNTGKADEKANPEKSSVEPFIEMYNQAVNEPSVQAWFRSQALKPETIRVFNDCVVGVVVRDGKETLQRFSATDGSGWGQVSQTISALQQVLSPSNLGLPATGRPNAIGRDVLLDFYGVKPPESEKSAHHLSKHLKNNGWPKITAARRDEWQRQFKELAQRREDSAVRARVVEQFRSQFTGEPDTNVLDLDDQNVKVDPGSSLDQRSKKPRQLFLQFLESATFQAFLKKAGYDLPGSEFRMPEFRLSEGDLKMRNLAGDWVSIQQAFDHEVERASRNDDAEGKAARKMNETYDQLVKMSKKTGNALYSTRTYDARQVLAFYAPDVPKTVGQLRATIHWLTTQMPSPPLAGDYAGMTPYGGPGLSSHVTQTLQGRSAQVEVALKAFSPPASGFQAYPDPDSHLAAFFDSPQAIAMAEDIAKSIGLYAVADGQALTRTDRHQLLATTLKFCVDSPVPGKRGTVAGYELYQPGNKGRTLKEVRERVERHLESKGVDPKVSALMAHLLLAQSAPEMLVKRDPGVDAEKAKLFNQDPENIKVGSTAWMNMRLGCEIAGDSRLNLTQVLALARQEATGPKQEALIKTMGVSPLLDWAVMNGIFPATSDGRYSTGDYEAASKAFSEREYQTREAFNVLMSEPPTESSVLVRQLLLLFPEMTEEEIRNLKVPDYPDTGFSAGAFRSGKTDRNEKFLIDVILMNYKDNKPLLGVKDYWTRSAFAHTKVDFATFKERLKQLPRIEPLVAPAVDKYIADLRAAQSTTLKLMIADLPLEDRKALEWGKITFYSVRQTTGDSLRVDQGPDSKVEQSKGKHGLLLRYETGLVKPRFGYYEVFPGSMTMVKRPDLPSKLPLDGKVENETLRDSLYTYAGPVIRNGTTQPFDFDAYSTGSEPRAGVTSQVIIEALPDPIPERTGHIHDRAPNTFASSKISQIVDRLVAYNFKDDRDARIAYANEPTDLYKRNHPFSTSSLFSAEGTRMLLSLIPFVGAMADLVEGKTGDGAKGLMIDFLSFFATGGWSGLKAFGKGLKMLIPFSGTPFTLAALKGGVTYIRGLFNPLEAIPSIFRGGVNGVKGLGKVANGVPVHIGSNIYLPVTTFEQWRWLSGASDSVFGNRRKNFPGARKGFSGGQEVLAVQKNGSWYAINPVSHKPEGTPLEHFRPAPV